MGVSQICKKGKTETKLLVDKVFSLGTNKCVGSKTVIKREILVWCFFASIVKHFERRGHRKGHRIESAAPQ